MRPSLKSSAIAALIGGCAIAGIAVASAGTPRDRAEHRSPGSSTSSTSMPTSAEPTEHAGSTEAVHSGRGRDETAPTTGPATREATETEHPNPGHDNDATETEHPNPEPGDDNDATETEHPNPGDDNGGATEPGDDRSGHDSGSGDSSGPGDNSGPGGGGGSGSGGGHSGSDG
jgi:hypothetical protein